MRRILLLITDLELGGVPTVLRELSARLHRLRGETSAEVEVASLSAWGPVASQIEAAGVKVTALGARRATDVRAIFRLARLIRRGGFDTVFSFLVHANVAATAARMLGARVRFFQAIQTTQPRPRWHWRAQRWVSRAAERIAVPSESVATVMRAWSGVPDEKLIVIPNAIDPGAFEISPVPAQDARPFPIGFIGRLDPIKRIPDLLEAVKILNGRVSLTVFGTGEQREHLDSEITRLGVGNWVTMFGPVQRAQDALPRIGLLVLCSDAEGLPLVVCEGMAAGVPVVGTDVAGIRDVVRHGETGLLVPARSPERLAEAIRQVVEDRELRARLAAGALEDVRRRFTWDAVIPQYRALMGI
jgi:glycosyltransferase involved in cell wall biosynthesis